MPRFAAELREKTVAVDFQLTRNRHTRSFADGREKIRRINEIIASARRRDTARPARDERHVHVGYGGARLAAFDFALVLGRRRLSNRQA